MDEYYFIAKHFSFPSLLAQKVFLAKKIGTIATAGGVSCYVQCNIPTWTVRKDMCTHEKWQWTTPFMQKVSLGMNPFTRQCP